MNLLTTSEEVPPPAILEPRERMTAFANELRACGYSIEACAKRLGVFPRLGVNFWKPLRPRWRPQENDRVDTLLSLLIDGCQVKADQLTRQFSSAFVDAALEMRLADKRGQMLESRLCLFPCDGHYVATDRALKNQAINQVMWLWGESYILGGLVKRTPRRRAIDLGTGSGIHGLLASRHSTQVVCLDVNPRALVFARFNAALNSIENVEVVQSDLFAAIDSTFDLMLANPPYIPDPCARAGDNFWSGGLNGTDVLQKIIEALPTRLDPDGTCHIISLFPNPPGTTIRMHFDRWLNGAVGHYQVLDHTWPVPGYQDILSEQPFQGDKSDWRFGVVSLRPAPDKEGWWKEATNNGIFFRNDGTCGVVADHDLVRSS